MTVKFIALFLFVVVVKISVMITMSFNSDLLHMLYFSLIIGLYSNT